MLPAFFAAFFFALNATCASRAVRVLGPARTNVCRLAVAALVLGAFAHTAGHGFTSASLPWFLLGGAIGLGLGDVGVYAALPLLGSRLTVLLTQCLAAPIAALAEHLWLGTRLSAAQLSWGLLILAGVALAITPSKSSPPRVPVRPIGFLFGSIGACGQGLGAVMSRKGVDVAEAAGEIAHTATFGLTAAYQRILAGLVFALAWFAVLRALNRLPAFVADPSTPRSTGYRWMLAAALAGPILGISCYQWALATTPSGIVLPIAATAPLLSIPIAFYLEGDRPTKRAIAGGLLAVAGCIALTSTR